MEVMDLGEGLLQQRSVDQKSYCFITQLNLFFSPHSCFDSTRFEPFLAYKVQLKIFHMLAYLALRYIVWSD